MASYLLKVAKERFEAAIFKAASQLDLASLRDHKNMLLSEFSYCIHTKKLSCLKSGVEFDMNDILYEFKNLRHF